MKKKIIVIILCIILISLCALSFCGCIVKASWFSEEYHIKKVSEKIQKRYINGNETISFYDEELQGVSQHVKATDFEIYPIYNVHNQLEYFLIEFEPLGYLYVKITDGENMFRSMYNIASVSYGGIWTPCQVDLEKNSDKEEDLIWEVDKNGKRIFYYKSPFYVRNIEEQKRYLIKYEGTLGTNLIPSIKSGERYTNLYSNNQFTIENGKILEKQANSISISFYLPNIEL